RTELAEDVATLGDRLHDLALVDPRLETPPEEVAGGPASVLAFLDAQVLDITTGPVSCVLTAVDFDEDGAICSSDCNEDDADIHVGADDSCPGGATDSVDQDCDGLADNGLECPDCLQGMYE